VPATTGSRVPLSGKPFSGRMKASVGISFYRVDDNKWFFSFHHNKKTGHIYTNWIAKKVTVLFGVFIISVYLFWMEKL
jgi:hypothetical protein